VKLQTIILNAAPNDPARAAVLPPPGAGELLANSSTNPLTVLLINIILPPYRCSLFDIKIIWTNLKVSMFRPFTSDSICSLAELSTGPRIFFNSLTTIFEPRVSLQPNSLQKPVCGQSFLNANNTQRHPRVPAKELHLLIHCL